MTTAAGGGVAGNVPTTRASWTFAVTPPRRSPSVLEGRQDTHLINVTWYAVGKLVHLYVNGHLRASTSREQLQRWLRSKGLRVDYEAGRLQLRYSDMGIWFDVRDETAPTVLAKTTIDRILRLLKSGH